MEVHLNLKFILFFWLLSIINSYETFSPPKNARLRQLAVDDVSGNIYVGADNLLCQLNADLDLMYNVDLGPIDDNHGCIPKTSKINAGYCLNPVAQSIPTDNVVKILVIDQQQTALIVCGNVYQGSCQMRNLQNIEELINFPTSPGHWVVANKGDNASFGFIAAGPSGTNVLYVGASFAEAESALVILPSIAIRRIDKNNSEHLFKLYKDTVSENKRTLQRSRSRTAHVIFNGGFASGSYRYFSTVKPMTPGSSLYKSRLTRICQMDEGDYRNKKLISYMEAPLECKKDGVNYPLLQAIAIGHAGSELATSLKIVSYSDIVVGLFSQAKESTEKPAGNSAVCIYTIKEIELAFENKTRDCWAGNGYSGLSFDGQNNRPKCNAQTQSFSHCNVLSNSPLELDSPIEKMAAYILKDATMLSLTVVSHDKYTVAFVGTSKGTLLKLLLEGDKDVTQFADAQVSETKVEQLALSKDSNYILAMAEDKLAQIPVAECDQYNRCSSCTQSNNPYCGWCVLKNRCSTQSECANSNQDIHWKRGKPTQCITITDISPQSAPANLPTKITLKVQAELPTAEVYECVFEKYGSTRATVLPSANNAVSTVTCDTPHVTTIEENSPIDLSLKASSNSEPFVTASQQLTIYDCTIIDTCQACNTVELNGNGCKWCPYDGGCIYQSYTCNKGHPVASPNVCPSLEYLTDVLIPAGIKKSFTLRGKHLPPPLTQPNLPEDQYYCVINIDGQKQQTTARLKDSSVLICEEKTYTYTGTKGVIKAEVSAIFANVEIDKPPGLSVDVYTCNRMASDCSQCQGGIDPKYKCSWCTASSQCMLESESCGSRLSPQERTCPPPKILSVFPSAGPLKGGTRVTITGRNLGVAFKDVESIYVADESCNQNLFEIDYVVSTRVVCETGYSSKVTSGPIRITVRGEQTISNTVKYSYLNPVIRTIKPNLGPKSGGSLVTIYGENLDIGTGATVECDNKECIEISKFCDGVEDCTDGTDEKPLCCKIGHERKTPDAPTCEDIDECKTRDGACSQYCHNTDGSFTCSCANGYTLQERPKSLRLDLSDKKTYCKASGPPLKLLVSIEKEIRILKEKPGDFTVIQMDDGYKASDNTISDFDYDYREKKVFWCSKHEGGRYQMTMWSANFTGNSLVQPKIILKNIDCGSLAVDWINHLVYWTVYSAETMVIEVVKYDGTDRRSLIWEGLSKPRMIAVVPEDGLLFWTDWGDDPHIGRANMDGTDRRILVQKSTGAEIRWPNALTVDLPTKHIYWMDAHHKSIESMDFDGGNRYTISKRFENLGHPWRMRVFEDRLFWTDWTSGGHLSSLNKFNGNDMKTISTDLKHFGLLSLRTYHPLSQPIVPNRCAKSKCTHLCILVPGGFQCGCPTGHKLLYDGTTCESYIESYAFVAMEGRIVKMALIPMEPTPQPIRFGSSPESQFNSLDYHNGWLYFNNISTIDSVSVTIDRMRYDGSEAKVLIEKKAKGGVAVDYVNDKLYWANEETVGVGELDGTIHTTIIQREGYDFRDILLAPCQGLMYLSVWGKGKGIFKAYTDGSHFKQIIWLNKTGNCNPSGLTFDKDSNSLFFTNDKSLYKVDLNKNKLEPNIIYNSSNSLVTRLYGAAIWGKNIIWTEWWDRKSGNTQGSAIMYMGKLAVPNGTIPQPIRYNLTQMPNAIKVHPRKGADCKYPNPCIDHDCSHLCLQRPRSDTRSDRKYTCVCPTGYALKEGSQTQCAEEITQYLVFNAEKGIQTISLDTSFLTPMKEPYALNNEVTSFDLDCASNTVYMCYNNNMFSARKLFDKKAPSSTTLPIHTLNCSGMAIEWITMKLFLADKGSSPSDGRILVIDINRPSLMSHIVMKISTPHDIAVHPRRGMIYWIDSSYNIWSTNMDGSATLQTIVHSNSKTTSSETITQLNIDYSTEYIYWTEEQIIAGTRTGFIKKVHIDKRSTEIVVQSPDIRIFGVAVMNDELYYTDSQGMLYKKSGNNPGRVILKTKRYPNNILFLKSSISQYSMVNPCQKDNGGCSDLCLIDIDGSRLCSCPTGIQLKDILNCDTPFNKTLLVANQTRINMLPIASNRETLDTVLTNQPKNLRSIDVDIRRNIIFWSEIPARPKESAAIWKLDMATRKTERLVYEDIKQPNSIAVDWNAENLYWLDAGDAGKGTLEVLSLRNNKRRTIQQYKKGSNNRPNQIVVDPKEKFIFVSYSVPSEEVIVKMWLDGSNAFSIPNKRNAGDNKKTFILTDLAIDIQNKRLYWATSSNSNQIETCNYDGEDFKTLRSEPGIDSLIQAMGVLNGNVFLQKQIDTGMEVRYFREGETTDAGTFPLEQIQGIIVSITVLTTDVLDGYVDMSCRRHECKDMICIPNHINVTCKCSTYDEDCKKNFEKKSHITTEILPFHPAKNSCPLDHCNGKGTCYTVQNSTAFYCECDPGYEKPRCSARNNAWKVGACIFGIVLIIVVICGICNHMRHCCNNNIKFKTVSSDESVCDTQSRDPRQQGLMTMGETAFDNLVSSTTTDTTTF